MSYDETMGKQIDELYSLIWKINSGDRFIHLPSKKIYECIGTDNGLIWYCEDGYTESRSFDKEECRKLAPKIEIKLDRSTLPKDGQQIDFQTQNEEWHEGYFVDGDDLFLINESKWYPAFDIIAWRPAQ